MVKREWQASRQHVLRESGGQRFANLKDSKSLSTGCVRFDTPLFFRLASDASPSNGRNFGSAKTGAANYLN